MIVVDASAVVDLLLDRGAKGDWVRGELKGQDQLHAPQLIDYEAVAVTRKKVLRSEIPAERGRGAIHDFAGLRIRRYPPRAFLSRALELRDSVTAYDAFYVALAEALDCPLVTSDLRLARSHGHDAEIRSPV